MKFGPWIRAAALAIVSLAVVNTPAHAWRKGQAALWDPAVEFGSNWDSYWSAKSGVATSGGNITTWTAAGSAARVATAVSTGAAVGTYNGLPSLTFAGSTGTRMSFSAAGLPTGASDVTLFTCGFAADNTNSKTALSIGSAAGGASTVSIRSLQITGSASGVQRTTGQYFVPSNLVSTVAQTQMIWRNNYRIVIGEFLSDSTAKQTVDGDPNLPAYPYAGTNNISTSLGRIGVLPTDTSPWDGPLQCAGIIKQRLTQLQKDKLSAWLAWEWDQVASLPDTNPYKAARPTVSDTTSSDLIAGIGAGGPMVQKFFDGFTSFSSRTGGSYIDNSTGYNDPSAKGTWAFDGLAYMTPVKGYPGFGQDVFVNANYNWPSIDTNYPILGQVDIGPNGLELTGSEMYPAVRSAFSALSAGPPYLSALVSTTQSAKIGLPFTQRFKWTINSARGEYSFPAVWSLGDLSNGTIGVTGTVTNGNDFTVSSVDTTPPQQPLILATGEAYRISGGGLYAGFNAMVASQTSGSAGGVGVYKLNKSLDQNVTASCSGTTVTVTAVTPGAMPLGHQASGTIGQTLTWTSGGGGSIKLTAFGTGTGGVGTYTGTPNCGTVASTSMKASITSGSMTVALNQQELDSMEQFGAENAYNVNSQHNHFFFNSFDQGPPGINFTFNPSTLMTGGSEVTTDVVVSSSYIWYLTNGVITARGDLTSRPPLSNTSLSWSGGFVTATIASQSFAVGQDFPVVISGATPSGYNGSFTATVTSATTFTYPLAVDPGANTVPGNYTFLVSYNNQDKWHLILNNSTGLSFEPYPGRFTGTLSDGSGGAGNVMTVANLSSGHVIIAPGQTVGQSTGTAFTPVVVQAFGGTCGGVACTGTGGAGSYLVSGSPQLVASTTMQIAPDGTSTGALTYTPKLTVRSVEIMAPSSNTTGVFPPTPPVPAITWGGCCGGGAIPLATPNGTVVGTVSGATRYQLLDRIPATPSHLTISGSNVVTSGALSAGTFDFYIRGCAADGTTCSGALTDGTPGIAPKITATIN